ncbi:MAG: acyl-CoA dehydrogenase [Myxococcales bacterium]|nr:acyl-CoA dehydrogenase [Myxococcales bacterium]
MASLDKETLDLTLQSLRTFVAERLPDDVLLKLDHDDEFPNDTVRALGHTELGIQLLFLPEDVGGMGGGAFDVYRVCEEMARADVGVATGVLATFLGSDPILFGGTEDQKKRWLGRIAEEGILMAYGATEPGAGSDLAALKTIATPVVEDGQVVGYRISGNKQWISNGGFADLYTILAATPGGPSWFVVERGAAGFSWGKPEDKHGIRASNTATLTLEDVYVDASALVGGVEGQGLQQAQKVFGFTRLMVAAFGLGAGWSAMDRAIRYSMERIQAGAPLSEKQGYTHKLIVPHVVDLEAARAYIEDTAARIDAGGGTLNTEGAIAKYLATEAGNRAADAAIQALGGYGYTREYMVEKIKRDVRITTIYEGTSEIMEMTISRDRWQDHLRSRGEHYRDRSRALVELERKTPRVGADIAALACEALAAVLEQCRLNRLTRNQHILFRLGELIARTEGADALAQRASRAAMQTSDPKSDDRFDPETLAAIARINARNVAFQVATDGLRWMHGADGVNGDADRIEKETRLAPICAAQAGNIIDMNRVADRLYGRA